MIKAKVVAGALQGAEIRPDALTQLDALATSVANALVAEVHSSVKARGLKTIREDDVRDATLTLFGDELGMMLLQHALNVRHRG